MNLRNKMNSRILRLVLILPLFILCVSYSYADAVKEKAREYYLKGNTYYQQGKYKEAQEEYKKALDILTQKEGLTAPQKEEVMPAPANEVKPGQEIKKIKQPQAAKEYIICDEDALHISVWQNPDLETDAIVRPDGKISFPLIGDVQATGITLTQLDDEITGRLKEYLRYPEVSICIKKLGGQKVMILGEVARPGVYSVTGYKTIIEAISLAGGFTRDAVPSSVVLIRGGFENPQPKRISLSKALKGDLRQNIELKSEDIIFVPKKFIADLNYFLSQVLEPVSRGAFIYKESQTW